MTSAIGMALKEWAAVVAGLERGDFSALIRKGGIREQRAGFGVRHERFLMYPTFFHENLNELAPSLRDAPSLVRPAENQVVFSSYAEVVAVWRVVDLALLRRIEAHHGMSWSAVEARFNYRGNPVIHVVAVQIMRLKEPVSIIESARYQGCVSWVRLDTGIDVAGALPAADPQHTVQRVAYLRSVLGEPIDRELA